MTARVVSVSCDGSHQFSKQPCDRIGLVAGLGVAGDAHAGKTVQHLSRLAKTPEAPNLRQVHLIHAELFDELARQGFAVLPGALGENVTTKDMVLLGLSKGTRLRLGDSAEIEITGLRNPCRQIDELASGLMYAMLGRSADGELVRKCGVMAVVLESGDVRPGDNVIVTHRPGLHIPLPVV